MIAEVLVAQNIAKPLTYQIPKNLEEKIEVGQAVTVPLKNTQTLAYIFKLFPDPQEKFDYKLKDIVDIKMEYSFFSKNTVYLLEWLSIYYVTPLIKILKSILPIGAKSNKKFKFNFNREIESVPTNILEQTSHLTSEQKQAYESIVSGNKSNFLLHGITGSGKTEVYITLIHNCIRNHKSVLVMVPEIALTISLQERLQQEFGDLVIPCHSRLTDKKRQESWLKAYNLSVSIVIGTRSAVFAPINNLGLIIIDEEQESAYKQENIPKYNGKVVAFKRAKIENAQVVVGSATPLVSTYYQAGKHYHIVSLKNRYKSELPSVKVIDFKGKKRPYHLISNELILEINNTLKRKEQIIIYYNQRGLYRFVRCNECGYVVQCSNCSVTMTVHQNNSLKCHYCGVKDNMADVCSNCNSTNLDSKGMGIQSVLQSLKKIFPFARIARLDSDNVRQKDKLEDILNEFNSNGLDILIGTQMIAKGHHFPNVTLVGVVDADIGLSYPDIYSSERIFNLLTQVIGRAGRSEKKGSVIIQTFNPDYYAIKCAIDQDYRSFYKYEIEFRKESFSPPFARVMKIMLDSNNEQVLQNEIDSFYKDIVHLFPFFEYYPPTYELVYKVKRRFRMHFIVKYKSNDQNVHKLKLWMLDKIKQQKLKSNIIVDVDPVSF